MKRICLYLFLLFPLAGLSQNFIGQTKDQVKKELQKQVVKNDSITITLTDNDTVLIYSIKDKKVLPVEFIYQFDAHGKCRSEKVVAGCAPCFNKYLQAVLARKRYEWKKINENQYISKYSARMMIELPAENKDFSYKIIRTGWTKELYKLLTEN